MLLEALAVTAEQCIHEGIDKKKVYDAIKEYIMRVLPSYKIKKPTVLDKKNPLFFATIPFVKIRFSKHAEKKFKDLKALGVTLSKRIITNTIKAPILLDEETDYPKKIASGKLDELHIVRVVYREKDDIIVVITFYPAKKERYVV